MLVLTSLDAGNISPQTASFPGYNQFAHRRLHHDMTLSTIQLLLRLLLALLLPLWIRSTTQHEAIVVLLTVILLRILAHLMRYTVNVSSVKELIIPVGGTFIANHVADYAVIGPWLRLIITYLLSWDALWYLFPDTDHMARVQAARQTPLTSSLILVLPLISAAVLTVYLGVYNYLNTRGSKCRTICIGFLVFGAIGNPMQHCTVALWYMVGKHFTAPSLENGKPALGKLELETIESTASIAEKSMFHQASLSTGREEMCQDGGFPELPNGMMEVLSDVPKMQGRPSTRRRG